MYFIHVVAVLFTNYKHFVYFYTPSSLLLYHALPFLFLILFRSANLLKCLCAEIYKQIFHLCFRTPAVFVHTRTL